MLCLCKFVGACWCFCGRILLFHPHKQELHQQSPDQDPNFLKYISGRDRDSEKNAVSGRDRVDRVDLLMGRPNTCEKISLAAEYPDSVHCRESPGGCCSNFQSSLHIAVLGNGLALGLNFGLVSLIKSWLYWTNLLYWNTKSMFTSYMFDIVHILHHNLYLKIEICDEHY